MCTVVVRAGVSAQAGASIAGNVKDNVNAGPVFAIFPIHGGGGVESRVTVDGLNISAGQATSL